MYSMMHGGIEWIACQFVQLYFIVFAVLKLMKTNNNIMKRSSPPCAIHASTLFKHRNQRLHLFVLNRPLVKFLNKAVSETPG